MTTPPSDDPFVRIVVLNWNSHWFTRRCLTSLFQLDHRSDRLEVVVLDNGSVDGSWERLRHEFSGSAPDGLAVRFVSNGENLGFAEGCNRGLRDLGDTEFVALVNNDAVVEPGWLREALAVLGSEPRAGAVATRLVLDPTFAPVELHVDGEAEITAVRVDGVDATDRTRYQGTRDESRDEWPMHQRRWATGTVTLLVPAGSDAHSVEVELRGRGRAHLGAGSASAAGDLGDTPRTLHAGLGERRTELLNGLGTVRNEIGEYADRLFGEPNDPALTPELVAGPQIVDGFCGGGVVLRSAMLDQVGVFDPLYFAYYEDSDLAWRARRAGWITLTAPGSVIRHSFGGSGASESPGFFFLNYRNWLLTVARNGDRSVQRAAIGFVARVWAAAVRRNVVRRLRRGQRPDLRLVAAWARTILGAAAQLRRVRSTSRPGVRPPRSVTSALRPSFTARPVRQRPGGPTVVLLDVTARLAERSAWGAVRDELSSAPVQMDLVPAVRVDGQRFRCATPIEVARLLGLETADCVRPDSDLFCDPGLPVVESGRFEPGSGHQAGGN